MNDTNNYIHGTSTLEEQARLNNQSEGSGRFLWNNINLKKLLAHKQNKPFIEIGSGVGSQTLQLISRLPHDIPLTCVDIDPEQITKAQTLLSIHKEYHSRITFKVQDVNHTHWGKNTLSGAYISWVLEHLKADDARKLLFKLKHAIQEDGIILANEIVMEPGRGMNVRDQNGLFPPATKLFLKAMIAYQNTLGGNANYGFEETMTEVFSTVGFKQITFRKILMEYPSSELPNSKKVALEMFDGIKKPLIEHDLFTNALYDDLLDEICHASSISWSCGQMLAIV